MERDYPVGHPAASDYKGEAYVDRFASYAYDFPEGHAARGGKNRSDLDTPDGVRESHLRQTQPLQDLAKQGSLPPVFDPAKKEPLPLSAEQLAHIYSARNAVKLNEPPTPDAKQAIGYIEALGYELDHAVSIFLQYLKPAEPADGVKG
ncbi:MAG TPA: hypothetical protein VNZ03_14900 [Terriglobales bacterium]|jgi:hypothetical protein|nr:hypothetical protein [Terriglobales bacterium]